MVGHMPLEHGIMVRIHVPELFFAPAVFGEGATAPEPN